MNRILLLLFAVLGLSVSSCSDGYDAAVCQDLSDKIVREQPLTQDDYADMLDQYEAILKYLISRADDIISIEADGDKDRMRRELRSDEDYLQRFSYMFTFGSVLYQAEVRNELDENNLAAYHDLERYSDEFADRTEEL